MKLFFFLLILFVPNCLLSNYYSFRYDKYLTARTGAENIIFAHKCISLAQNLIYKPKYFAEDNIISKAIGLSLRTGYAMFVDYPLIEYGMLIQHEYFGHGAALRELGASEIKYIIRKPYEPGRSLVKWTTDRSFSLNEQLWVRYSGTQANTILAESIRAKSLIKGSIDFNSAHLFLRTFHDITRYVVETKTDKLSMVNDIQSYLYYLNQTKHFSEDRLNLKSMKKYIFLNFLDPFQLICFWSYVKNYAWDGHSSLSIPYLKLFDYSYLPGLRIGLTPFGMEYYIENSFVFSHKMVNFLYRKGFATPYKSFWGIGFDFINIINIKTCSINIEMDLWNQPPLSDATYNIQTLEENNIYGGELDILFHMQALALKIPIYLTLHVCYKTDGFLEGKSLYDEKYVSFGCTTRFK